MFITKKEYKKQIRKMYDNGFMDGYDLGYRHGTIQDVLNNSPNKIRGVLGIGNTQN